MGPAARSERLAVVQAQQEIDDAHDSAAAAVAGSRQARSAKASPSTTRSGLITRPARSLRAPDAYSGSVPAPLPLPTVCRSLLLHAEEPHARTGADRLRSASHGAGDVGVDAVSRRDVARNRGAARHRRAEHDFLSVQQPAHGAGRLAGREGQACNRRGTVGHRGAGPVRDPDCHLQLPVRRAGDVQRGPGRRHGARGQRLDRPRVAGSRPQAARLDRGAAAESRTGGGGDRTLRRRPPVHPGDAAGLRRTAARAAAELADLCRRRAPRAAGGDPCRQHLPPSQLAGRLGQLLQRGLHQPGRRVSDPAHRA